MFESRRRLVGPIALVAGLAIAFPLGVLATISFADVPPGHPFYYDIQEVANAGVTTGCGGGNYCPDQNVTRGQMAAFMNRLGALGADRVPVVNADKVDGIQGSALATKAEVSALPGAHVIAVGAIDNGAKHVGFANQGTWTATRTGVGTYRLDFPGASPGCVEHPITMTTPLFAATIVRVTGGSIACATGDTTVFIATTSDTGAATDSGFLFTAFGPTAPAIPTLAGTKTPASTVPAGATTCTINASGEASCE